MAGSKQVRIVYVVGAGLSAGLTFPTTGDLLPKMWDRVEAADLSNDLADVIRFHHPNFNPALLKSYPDIEQLLSEMEANAKLFDSSRPATGNFTSEDLEERRKSLLLVLAKWFHEQQATALQRPLDWLLELIDKLKAGKAQVISFNWDLVLDELLFGDRLRKSSYGLGKHDLGPRLIKPHGSLNWYEQSTGKHLKEEKRFSLGGKGSSEVFAFKAYREPKSTRRRYMPLIVPPVYMKEFNGDLFRRLWQETVSVLSTAGEVKFLGYSLPASDFPARFILRCGFHNQEFGELQKGGGRAPATGRAKVTIVDPGTDGPMRVKEAVGWECDWQQKTIANWIQSGGLS